MYEAAAKQATEGAADEAALRRVRDRAEVEELLIRYTMSVDLRDWTLFRSCFGERVRVRFDPAVVEAPEGPIAPEEWAVFASVHHDTAASAQHYYSIYSIRLDSGQAEAVMCYRAGQGGGVDEGPFSHTIYYTYRCRRGPEGWKIDEISAHTLPAGLEQGPALDEPRGTPPSQVRARGRVGKGAKRPGTEPKRTQRSAAKRR